MAIAVDASSPAAVTSTSTTATTASFTPGANSLLLAFCAVGNSTGSGLVTATVTDSVGATWTLVRRLNATGVGSVECWVLDAGASPAARTVTLTGSGSNGKGTTLVVHCVTGARLYNSGNTQFTGAFTQASSGTGANLSAKALGQGSISYYAILYNPASVTWTARGDNTALANVSDTTNGQAAFVSRVTSTSTQGTTYSGGTTNTGLTSGGAVQLFVEVLEANTTLKNNVLNLWSQSADSAVTVTESNTMLRLGLASLRSVYATTFTYANRNTVTGPTAPLQATDSSVVGTDGTAVSWITEPLKGVTVAGQIIASLYGRESNSAANVAILFSLDRCANDGTYISTIVDIASPGFATGGEVSTAAGGATKTLTIAAADVVDTTLVDGDRLRVRVWFDDAADRGGTGNMAAAFSAHIAYAAWQPGTAGDSKLTFTENLEQYVSTGATQTMAASSSGTSSTAATSVALVVAASSSVGTSTTIAAPSAVLALTVAADGTSTALAAARASWALTGASQGTSAVAAATQATFALTAASAGAGAVSAAAAVLGDGSVSATATGTSTTSAAVAVTRLAAASSTGTSTAASAAALVAALVATSPGSTTTSAAGVRAVVLTSTSTGTSTSTSAAAIAYAVSAFVAGIADVLAAISAGRRVIASEPLTTVALGLERTTKATTTERVTSVAPTDRETQRP